ncbi:prolyl hydroxylase family protein [Hymenobacter actinosclerus]|uniref:Predicted 2-oxoglutarate-and Fe(II)-dependent dioxygenase YbiX n=1 Tax=Hymenobacter actinosclerus TaxID=82805 RepID=A0A1I0DYZ8_9BACT|nr:2OG-Fe(II) oxygenase [Hymenobacter actinosclerus]SET37078.1 Predicted 2-oxoglutarate-and Fe(II)-dependent dioxygenase YbiX [Hymenobacter actinosclerus]
MLLHRLTDSIFEITDFLSPAECTELIARSEQLGYTEAGVNTGSSAQLIKGIRNNYRLEYPAAELAETLWQRLRPLLPVEPDGAPAVGLHERLRFYRYDVGERFNKHKDGRTHLSADVASRWTFLLYLNADFMGGETEFEALTVAPRRGAALCFRHELRHKGCAVTSGRKYVLRTDVLFQGE